MPFFRLVPSIFFLLFLCSQSLSQEDKMRVLRCTAVDRATPIHNLHIDGENQKWLANADGLHRVYAVDHGVAVDLAGGIQSLYEIPDGNGDISWPKSEMDNLLGPWDSENVLTTALYQQGKDALWIGTSANGVYQLKVKPNLKIVRHLHIGNSKMRSNYVNTLHLGPQGNVWIGTQAGALIGNDDKWKLEEKYFSIEAITSRDDKVWIMGEGLLWKADARSSWTPIHVDDRMVEEEIRDMAMDGKGRLWIASNVMTCYDVEASDYKIYGPGQYFTSQFVNCVAVDKEDAIWIGTRDKGLYQIELESAITVNALVDNPLSCDGSKNDASLIVRIVGGEAPYTYAWEGGLSGENPQDLGPGEYFVTITDSEGREKSAKGIIEDPRIDIAVSIEQIASGEGVADGIASLTINGGTPDYSYAWDNGETESKASRLAEGQHGVTVTDKYGCSAEATFEMNREIATLAVQLEQTEQIRCSGGSNAALSATVSGGKGPFTYAWQALNKTTREVTGLANGEYTLIVTDAVSNTAAASYIVEEPVQLSVQVRIDAPASTGAADGSAALEVTGGTAPYAYAWSNGESNSYAFNLAAGDYGVTVTDVSGCTSETTFAIDENILPLAIQLSATAPINCYGQETGAVAVTVSGGKEPYNFTWNDAGRTGSQLADLGAGSYGVTVTDVSGLSETGEIVIDQPEMLEVVSRVESAASTNNADGSASVSIKGGTKPYQLLWDNEESGEKAVGLAPGMHSVTVTDGTGCTATASVEIPENILPLTAELDLTSTNKCAGEAMAGLQTVVRGGKAPFTYRWSTDNQSKEASGLTAGMYVVTVTDAAGTSTEAEFVVEDPDPISIELMADAAASTNTSDGRATAKAKGGSGKYTYQWDNGEESNKARQLGAGLREVVVTDSEGCTAQASIEITENILPLSVQLDQTSTIKCPGENTAALLASVQGGKAPFSFQWSNPDLASDNADNLGAGNYSVTVTDAVGNTSSGELQITEPEALEINLSADAAANTNKSNGQATLRITGGNGGYSYAWDNGESSARATELAPGLHTVTITDKEGCTGTAQVEIAENILPLGVTITPGNDIKCFGDQTAQLIATVNGGKSPFTYTWNDGSNGEERMNLAAGNYSLTVVDAAGTEQLASFEILQPELLAVVVSLDQPATTDEMDGKATAKVEGGTAPFKYAWGNGESGAQASTLGAGTYTLTVTDAAGCRTTANLEMTEDILPLVADFEITSPVSCAGASDASVEITISGGKRPFQVSWTGISASGQNPTGLTAGEYAATVSDALGSDTRVEFRIEEPAPLAVEVTKIRPATSERYSDGRAQAMVAGGSGAYSYRWDNDEDAENATTLSIGRHGITVTDANGCTATASFDVSKKILPDLTAERLATGQPLRMEKLTFEADSANLAPGSELVLQEVFNFLDENPTIVVEIGGHTNGLPEHEFCDRLSTARAKTVAQYMVRNGIDEKRVYYKGYGKRKPIATNKTADGRKRNQRVEVRILKLNETEE